MRTWMVVAGTLIASGLAVVLAVEVATPAPLVRAPMPAEPLPVPRVQPDREALAAARREARALERAERREARAERQEELKAERQAAREAKKEPRLSPEERALARADTRAAQLDDLIMAHDDVCAQLGIPVEDADEVAVLLLDTTEMISMELERVDRGELTWEEIRPTIRRMRLDQATQAERLLGRETFQEWTLAMGFERFADDEWERGRLNARKGGKAKRP